MAGRLHDGHAQRAISTNSDLTDPEHESAQPQSSAVSLAEPGIRDVPTWSSRYRARPRNDIAPEDQPVESIEHESDTFHSLDNAYQACKPCKDNKETLAPAKRKLSPRKFNILRSIKPRLSHDANTSDVSVEPSRGPNQNNAVLHEDTDEAIARISAAPAHQDEATTDVARQITGKSKRQPMAGELPPWLDKLLDTRPRWKPATAKSESSNEYEKQKVNREKARMRRDHERRKMKSNKHVRPGGVSPIVWRRLDLNSSNSDTVEISVYRSAPPGTTTGFTAEPATRPDQLPKTEPKRFAWSCDSCIHGNGHDRLAKCDQYQPCNNCRVNARANLCTYEFQPHSSTAIDTCTMCSRNGRLCDGAMPCLPCSKNGGTAQCIRRMRDEAPASGSKAETQVAGKPVSRLGFSCIRCFQRHFYCNGLIPCEPCKQDMVHEQCIARTLDDISPSGAVEVVEDRDNILDGLKLHSAWNLLYPHPESAERSTLRQQYPKSAETSTLSQHPDPAYASRRPMQSGNNLEQAEARPQSPSLSHGTATGPTNVGERVEARQGDHSSISQWRAAVSSTQQAQPGDAPRSTLQASTGVNIGDTMATLSLQGPSRQVAPLPSLMQLPHAVIRQSAPTHARQDVQGIVAQSQAPQVHSLRPGDPLANAPTSMPQSRMPTGTGPQSRGQDRSSDLVVNEPSASQSQPQPRSLLSAESTDNAGRQDSLQHPFPDPALQTRALNVSASRLILERTV